MWVRLQKQNKAQCCINTENISYVAANQANGTHIQFVDGSYINVDTALELVLDRIDPPARP